MHPSEAPFGLLHVLAMAAVGCLAFAAFTDEWLWTGIALFAAAGLAAWAYIVAKREYGRDEYGSDDPTGVR
jgi:hypothetical protein